MQVIVGDTPTPDASARGVDSDLLHPRTAKDAGMTGHRTPDTGCRRAQASSGATSTETRRVDVFASVKMMPFTGETSP